MNIIARPYGCDLCYCRPDTTWERENRDIYSPDCVAEWNWTPVLYARICKAGKCISPKYVSRYYDSVNFGVLLYVGGIDTAFSSCADHTSLLPTPSYSPDALDDEANVFRVLVNGEEIFSTADYATEAFEYSKKENGRINLKTLIEDTICKASGLTSLRIGDFVTVELKPQTLLCSRIDGETVLKTTFQEDSHTDCKIIF